MKFLVCISKTPDTTTKIGFVEGNTRFDTDKVQYIMNPYDEWYALVRAMELKESGGGSVTVVNVGPASNDAIIRKALAIGADDAVRINADDSDSFFVASQIAAYAKDNAFDVILAGKETIDYNGSEVPSMIAELLDMPFVSYASSLEMAGNEATIARDIEGGKEVVAVQTPFVVSAAKGMAEQRIPNMRGIMMAKKKPLQVIEPVGVTTSTKISSYALPPAKSDVRMVDPENMDELVQLLHNEAKVI